MSQITEALNKIQKTRKDPKDPNTESLPTIPNAPLDNSRMLMIGFIAVGIIAGVFISIVVIALDIRSSRSNQTDLNNLKKILQVQEKEIKYIEIFLNKSNSLSDSQAQNFNYRLKNEVEYRKAQVSNLSLIDNVYYINLMKSIIANTQQINYLDQYILELKSKLEKNTNGVIINTPQKSN